nr:interference hedgehog-like [Danio rerio]|eukprot:XP_017210628.1 interference hedgehog-like [Danio rerio]
MALAEKICIFAILLQGVCCKDFNISLPEKIQALSGSCVIIKCRFEINETYDKDLTEKTPVNPQVVLYKDKQELQDQQEVLEGRSVSLRCSAKTLCSSPPATLTWSSTARIPHSESSKQQDLIVSDLIFTAAPRHNRVTFTCSISYQLQDNNRTAHSSITLHVQYAPQIFSYSSCTSTNVTVCFCEVDGNPLPEVEWHLSGHLVLNSSNTFISEERLSNTSLRSFISLQQFLSHTNTLLCLSKNSHGSASQQLHMNFVSTEASCKFLSVIYIV